MQKKGKKNTKLEILSPQGFESGDKPQKMKMKVRKAACDRCGACCASGGPVLLREDVALFSSGVLSHGSVYTLREGELVRSKGDGEVYESFLELIKVREKDEGGDCAFYNAAAGCSIYEDRPSQCRTYRCWTPGDVLPEGLEQARLTRRQLFAGVDVLIEAMDRHEVKCSYSKLADALVKLEQGEEAAVEDIMDMLQYDTYARPFLTEKFNVPPDAMDLVLGRPMTERIREFGFEVVRDGDDYVLTVPEKKEEEKK